MRSKKFIIIGLGLIGGSLGAALRKSVRGSRVVGVSRSRAKIRFARSKRLIHEGTTDLRKAVGGASVVFVCSPVDTIPRFLSQLDRVADEGTVVTDVGSTKAEIVRWADRKNFKRIRFVGSHPLAGSHLTGPEHAQADLFYRAHVFLTPTRRTDRVAKKLVASLWKRLKCRVHMVNARQHDQIVGEISHLPHAVATCLVQSISRQALRFSGTGFRDTTRVAQGDPNIWAPIFLSNRRALKGVLRQFEKRLHTFQRALKTPAPGTIRGVLRDASVRRKKARSIPR